MNFLLRVAFLGVVAWLCVLLSSDVERLCSIAQEYPDASAFLADLSVENMTLTVSQGYETVFSLPLEQPACGLAACLALMFLDGLVGSIKRRKKKARRRLYINVIRDNVRRVEDIAAVAALPNRLVRKELRKIVKKGKGDFKGAYFNEATQEIVFPGAASDAPQKTAETPAPAADDDAQKAEAPKTVAAPSVDPPVATPNDGAPRRTVVCKACGASVTIVGNEAECEYCGSRLD